MIKICQSELVSDSHLCSRFETRSELHQLKKASFSAHFFSFNF